MKIASVLLGLALVVISGVLIFLLKSGGALKPAGVIKPTLIGPNPDQIGQAVAVRLFPEFHASKNVVWYLPEDQSLARIPEVTHSSYQKPEKPILRDLRVQKELCPEGCWYTQPMGQALPEELAKKIKTEPTVEIWVQYFDREDQVSEVCEKEKILEPQCLRSISVREVHRKLKSSESYYFMQRYQGSQFYLFVEKSGAGTQ